MTTKTLEFIRDMVNATAILVLTVWLSFTGHYLGIAYTQIAVVNNHLNTQIAALVSQVQELQTKVVKLEALQAMERQQ